MTSHQQHLLSVLSDIISSLVKAVNGAFTVLLDNVAIEIQQERQRFANSLAEAKRLNDNQQSTVILEVSSDTFHVGTQTLGHTESMLSAIALFPNPDGDATFIDRDAEFFPLILHFLRTGCALMPLHRTSAFLREARYYNLHNHIHQKPPENQEENATIDAFLIAIKGISERLNGGEDPWPLRIDLELALKRLERQEACPWVVPVAKYESKHGLALLHYNTTTLANTTTLQHYNTTTTAKLHWKVSTSRRLIGCGSSAARNSKLQKGWKIEWKMLFHTWIKSRLHSQISLKCMTGSR